MIGDAGSPTDSQLFEHLSFYTNDFDAGMQYSKMGNLCRIYPKGGIYLPHCSTQFDL